MNMDGIRKQIHGREEEQIFREHIVVSAVIKHLKENGWKVKEGISVKGGKIDIGAEKQGKIFLIEAKGEDKGGYGSAEMNFQMGLGQLMSRMTSNEADYGLAIPLTSNYKRALRKYQGSFAFEKLSVYLLVVRENGTCRVILPSDVFKFLAEV